MQGVKWGLTGKEKAANAAYIYYFGDCEEC